MDAQSQETNKMRKWKPRPRYMGMVTNWIKEKGFGFIQCFDDGKSYFAHSKQLTDDYELIRGSIVEFEKWRRTENPDEYFAAKILVCEVPETNKKRKKKHKNRVVTN